jgi:acylphosphatase
MNTQPTVHADVSDRQVIRLQIRGKVQGVYYRASMVDAARRLGVTGWVRNRGDGSVEAMACGTHIQLENLTEWARRGPPAAMVAEVLIAPGEGEFSDFVQWQTA